MPYTPTDIKRFADALGDPANYFVHFNGNEELVVEHATGDPKFRVSADGTLAPYERPAPVLPAPAAPSAQAAAAPAGFAGGATVTNPPARPQAAPQGPARPQGQVAPQGQATPQAQGKPSAPR